jgi:hypothetical protein
MYLDEAVKEKGTKKFELIQYFDLDNLLLFKKSLLYLGLGRR